MVIFLFQAEDGIRDLVRSRGLGDVYKRQVLAGGQGTRLFELTQRESKPALPFARFHRIVDFTLSLINI